MKTKLASATAMFLFASLAAASAQSAPPTEYKALRDFSYLNPGGVWSYGYGTAGNRASIVVYPSGLVGGCFLSPNPISDCFFDSNSLVAANFTGKTQVVNLPASSIVIPVDALQLNPRQTNEDTMVIFTAPADGFYKMEGFYEILDNRPTGVAPKIFVGSRDLTRKAFGSRGDVILTGPSNPDQKKVGEKRKFDLTFELRKGFKVQFALGAAGDWQFDSTGFDVTVTPVAVP